VSIDPELNKAVLVLTLLRRQPASRARDVVTASILSNLASRFGGPVLLYATFAVFLAEDHFDELQAAGMLDLEPQVQALLAEAKKGYTSEYENALERAHAGGAYAALREAARDSQEPLAGPNPVPPGTPRN
jgi:hypothetical protein